MTARPKLRAVCSALCVIAVLLCLGTVAIADDLVDSVPASHRDRRSFEIDVSCPPVLPAGAQSHAVVVLKNHRHSAVTVTRGASTVHAGELRVRGPFPVAIDAVVEAASAEGMPGTVSVTVPVLVPANASRGTLVTFGLTFLGHAGTAARRQILGSAACTVEVGKPNVDVLSTIEVQPVSAVTVVGGTAAFVARGVFASGAVQQPLTGVTWSSDATGIATVGATGIVTGRALGTARIRASRDGVTSAPATVAVKSRAATSLVLAGRTFEDGISPLQLSATVLFSDGTSDVLSSELAWTSSLPAVASITPTGMLSTHAAGSTLITARHPDGVSASATFVIVVPVGAPTITSVSPSTGTALGGTVITVRGTNFTAGSSAGIGLGADGGLPSFPPADLTIVSPSEMQITTGPGPPGVVTNVTVHNSKGDATAAGAFGYVFPFSVPGAVMLAAGTTGALRVTLAEPAATAVSVNVASSDSSVAAPSVPVTIPAGQAAIDVAVMAGSVDAATVTINGKVGATARTASVSVAIGSSSLTTGVVVTAAFSQLCGPLGISCSVEIGSGVPGALVVSDVPPARPIGAEVAATPLATVLLVHGAAQSVALPLAAPAPAGGLCIDIGSNNTAVATVNPVQRCVDAGAPSFSFTINGIAAGEAIITAVAAGGETFHLSALVDRAIASEIEVLARPAGVLVAPVGAGEGPILARVAGIAIAPTEPRATLSLGSGASRAVTLVLSTTLPPGPCASAISSDVDIATAENCTIAADGLTLTVDVRGVASGQATVTVSAGGQVQTISVLVNQTVTAPTEMLAAPVGVLIRTDEPTLAPVVEVSVCPEGLQCPTPCVGPNC